MCVRRYEDNWGELKGKLMEKDVLEVLSLSAFCRDEGCADIPGCISGHPVFDEARGTKEAGGAEEGAV